MLRAWVKSLENGSGLVNVLNGVPHEGDKLGIRPMRHSINNYLYRGIELLDVVFHGGGGGKAAGGGSRSKRGETDHDVREKGEVGGMWIHLGFRVLRRKQQ